VKFYRSVVPARKVDRDFKEFGVLGYDFDNAYPQRVIDIVNASGTAKHCINLYSKFIEGKGFKDQVFYKTRINCKGLTLDKLLSKISKDYALNKGLAIHVNYNGLFQISDMRFIPFRDCRLPHTELEEHAGKIALYHDWAKRKKSRIKKEDIKFYDRFDPNPETIMSQIEKAGGIEHWRGQIFWYSSEDEDYPLATCDAILEDVETDGRIKSYKRKKSATGWGADFAFIHKGKFENENERNALRQDIEEFQGDDNAGGIPIIEVEIGEQAPELLLFPKVATDKDFYSGNEQSVQANIRKAYGFPPVLVGDYVAGKLGMAQEILDATGFVNGMTNPERRMMEEIFQTLFSYWHVPIAQVNPTNDFSIIPLELIAQVATKEVSAGEEAPTNAV
jgi:hypothetical protein